MSLQRVCALSDVPEGEIRTAACGQRRLAISNVDGTLFAIDDLCTHDGGPLGEGRLLNGRVLCPRHGAAFDARTGEVRSLPAVAGVRAYEVVVQGDDVLVDCGDGAA